MEKLIIRMVLNTEDENIYDEIKQEMNNQLNILYTDLSFSPLRPYFRYANYGECSISLMMFNDQFEGLKQYLSSYWQGEYEDDIETDSIMATLFHPNVYYMNLQIL